MAHLLPAIRGSFGALDCYLVMVPPNEIEEVVGHDPRLMMEPKSHKLTQNIYDLYQDVQRAVDKGKVAELEEYVERYSQEDAVGIGALPALSVGFKKAPAFLKYDGLESYESELGRVKITSIKDNALYLDGLKRACAILNRADKLGKNSMVAVMLFAPKGDKVLSHADLAQLFYDFNSKATPIPRNVAVSRDGRDPHIQLANLLSECDPIKINGGVDRLSKSLGNKSGAVLVIKDMVSFARAAADDSWAVEHLKNPIPESVLNDPEKRPRFEEHLVAFLRDFIESMGREKFRDRLNHVHLMAPVWATIGIIFHDLYIKLELRGVELSDKSRALGALDWRRTAERLAPHMQDKVSKNKNIRVPIQGGSQMRRQLVPQVRMELAIADQVSAWETREKATLQAAE
jgi:hypothetical protein